MMSSCRARHRPDECTWRRGVCSVPGHNAPAATTWMADRSWAIERMRLLQIDSTHLMVRRRYIVPYPRLGNDPIAWLEEALAGERLSECWAHETRFVSAVDIGGQRADVP